MRFVFLPIIACCVEICLAATRRVVLRFLCIFFKKKRSSSVCTAMGSENPQSGSSCHRRTPTQADENSGSAKDRQAHEVLVSSTIQQRTIK